MCIRDRYRKAYVPVTLDVDKEGAVSYTHLNAFINASLSCSDRVPPANKPDIPSIRSFACFMPQTLRPRSADSSHPP